MDPNICYNKFITSLHPWLTESGQEIILAAKIYTHCNGNLSRSKGICIISMSKINVYCFSVLHASTVSLRPCNVISQTTSQQSWPLWLHLCSNMVWDIGMQDETGQDEKCTHWVVLKQQICFWNRMHVPW